MTKSCAECGRPLSEHDRHVRFDLPDPVVAADIDLNSDAVWMSDSTPRASVFLEVAGLGSFVRALAPVKLTGGYSTTFGVWVAIHPDEMRRALTDWFAPSYPNLALDGILANDLVSWSVLGAPVRLEVRDADETPYCVASTSPKLTQVLTEIWPHESVLVDLPS